MNRAEILETAQKCVCGQREQDYGKPEDNFATIGLLWGTYLRAAYPELQECFHIDRISPKDVAIMMALLKVARIATGNKEDSFVDLAGYAACAGEVATGGVQRAVEPPAAEPEGTKSRWIPVSECLPCLGEKVNVLWYKGNGEWRTVECLFYPERGGFWSPDYGTLEARPEYWAKVRFGDNLIDFGESISDYYNERQKNDQR